MGGANAAVQGHWNAAATSRHPAQVSHQSPKAQSPNGQGHQGGGRSPGEVVKAAGNLANSSAAVPQAAFGPEEWTGYERIFKHVSQHSQGRPEAMPQFLAKSGLHRRALREIWSVANPEMKNILGPTEFARCCRLIAHCQAVMERGQPQVQELLHEGGRPLR